MQVEQVSATEWKITDDDGVMSEFFGRAGMSEEEVLASFDEAMNPPAPTAVQLAEALQASCIAAIDAHVEAIARSRSYNSAAHLAGYATSTVPQWAAEAQAFVTWRDQVWQAAYAMLGEVEAGTIPAPTPADAVAALPAISWPEG